MQTLKIKQGNTFSYKGTITDSDDALVDLTGHSFRGSIKKKPTDPGILFAFTILNQTTNKGEFIVTMDAATTKNIPVKAFNSPDKPDTDYLGDMEIIFPDTTVKTFFEFIAEINSGVDTQ